MKNLLSNTCLASALLISGLTVTEREAEAVALGHQGIGQALIYPYYTVRNGQVNLLSVENNAATPKAVFVTIREGKAGQVILNFHLYLSAFDTWTAALHVTDGVSASIFTNEGSCTVPQFFETSVPLRFFGYTGDAADDDSVDRMFEGSIEMIEMAEISGEHADWFDPSSSEFDCSKVLTSWASSSGVWRNDPSVDTAVISDSGSLSGSLNIVDPLSGSSASYKAIALLDFDQFDNNFIMPGSLDLDLDDAGDSQGEVTSVVLNDGVAITSHWEDDVDGNGFTGLDAVSAVLTANRVINQFSSENLNGFFAGSDWVLAQPTRYGYVPGDGSAAAAPYSAPMGSSGACETTNISAYTRAGQLVTGAEIVSNDVMCWATSVVSFVNPSTLDSTLATVLPLEGQTTGETASGRAVFGFGTDGESPLLSSDEGHQYRGLPVVGFLVQEFIDLNVESRANYMSLYPHSSLKSISTE